MSPRAQGQGDLGKSVRARQVALIMQPAAGCSDFGRHRASASAAAGGVQYLATFLLCFLLMLHASAYGCRRAYLTLSCCIVV
jgi:hypothetical protein